MAYQKCLAEKKRQIEGLPEKDVPGAIQRILKHCQETTRKK